ncbi:MAG: hypothetical protein WCX86_04910 [Candidatus Hydrogenedentales bacterium]|jgi:glucose-6-phosphate isomerase
MTQKNTTDQQIRIDIRRATAAAVGAAHGITPEAFQAIEPRILKAHEQMRADREAKKYGFYDLYKEKAVLKEVQEQAAQFVARGYDNLVVLGIGGSALGLTALHTALSAPYHNLMDRDGRKGRPRLFVMDNIDPVTFTAMMQYCDPAQTLFNVISKSGDTAETMAQLMIVVDMLEKSVGAAAMKDHLVVTTGPGNGNGSKSLLHPVAEAYDLITFEIPVNVGGRFSVFSPVGMFPAAVLGMDIEAMMAGCEAMDERCSKASLEGNPAYLRAAVQYMMDVEKGKTMSVMMPYADGLRDVADWYRQLWAESLGKRYDGDNKEVFVGPTPIKALGVTDQHSQVQLYREGPNNKVFNILEVERFTDTLPIPPVMAHLNSLDYLRNSTMNKLMEAELLGTMDALQLSQRPVIRIILPELNAYTLAQVLYLLEVETAMAGQLYNIDAFNQPGVEEGKIIARTLMGDRK